MGQFLYYLQPIRITMLSEGPTDSEAKIIEEHFQYLQNLVNEGTVFMAGRTLNTDSTAFGIVVFQTDSEASAKTIMANDPAVTKEVMKAQLFPYKIALWSSEKPSL